MRSSTPGTLYSREFTWHYRPAASVKDELLQRYSLVAHLAPEVRHGLDVVRAQREVMVGSVVTCGDLPDLRSLTMPLIEELDIEVETLDTLEGMDVTGLSDRNDLAERASALCLAVSVGAGEPGTYRSAQTRFWLAAAAAVVALTLAGWFLSKAFNTPTTSASAAAPAAESAARTQPPAAKPLPPEPQPPTGAPVAVSPVVSAPPPSTDASTPAATTGRHEASELVRESPRGALVASAFRRKLGADGSLPSKGGSHATEPGRPAAAGTTDRGRPRPG